MSDRAGGTGEGGASSRSRQQPGPVPLRPMNLGDVADGMFKLFTANWRTMLLIAGIFSVPLQLLLVVVQREALAQPGLLAVLSGPADDVLAEGAIPNLDQVLLGSLAAFLLATLVVQPLVAGGLCRVAVGSSLGTPVGLGDAVGTAVRHWWALVVARLLVVLAYACPFVLSAGLVVAGVAADAAALIVVGVLLAFAAILVALLLMALFVATTPAIVAEGLGPLAGLRRSARLMRPRLWAVLGIVLLVGLVASLAAGALSSILNLPGQAVGGTAAVVLLGAGGIVSSLVQAVLGAMAASLVYLDGRIRGEGLDLALASGGAEDLAGWAGQGWQGGFPGP